MEWLASSLRKMWIWLRREKYLNDLEEEMRFHREQTEEELRNTGLPSSEAAHAATRQFGNAAKLKDQAQAIVGFRVEAVLQDAGFALRQLLHNRTFAIVAITVLSLGIGISTAMFTVFHDVLLNKPDIPQLNRLVTLSEPRGKIDAFWGVSLPDLRDWKAQNHSFEQLAYYKRSSTRLELPNNTVRLMSIASSANFFSTLGVAPQLGRSFVAQDEANRAKVVILSYRLWQEQFGGKESILNQAVKVDGELYQVIGVMPKGFAFPSDMNYTQGLWRPFVPDKDDEIRESNALSVFARLRPGVKPQSALTEMNGIQARLARTYAGKTPFPDHVVLRLYWDTLVGKFRPALFAITFAVALVWLVACANVASLMLTRNAARQREIAVREALGAGKRRIVRQLLTESFLLSSVAGALGLLLSYSIIHVLKRTLLQTMNQQGSLHLETNWTVVLAVVAITILSTLFFGLLPAIDASRGSVQESLKTKIGETTHKKSRLRDGLVTAEIAISLLLLISAGLMLRTIYSLHHIPLGFRTENVLTTSLSIPEGKYEQKNINTALFQPLLEKTQQLPSVESAAITSVIPLSRSFKMIGMFGIVGRHETNIDKRPQGDLRFSSPDYPKTLGITVERGRFFDQKIDTPDSQPVAVVNHTFAAQYLAGLDPLQVQLSMGGGNSKSKWAAVPIVGVLSDVRETSVDTPPGPEIHLSTTQLAPDARFYSMATRFTHLAIRTKAKPQAIITPVKQTLHELAPDVTTLAFLTMSEVVEDSLTSQTLAARLIAVFAGITLLIAIAGLYGLMNYSVSQRTREVGVRMALGAERTDVILLVLRRAALLLGMGLAIGIALATATSRLLRSYLYGVREHDLVTILSVSLLLLLCGLLAAFLPAKRAASVNPVEALRTE